MPDYEKMYLHLFNAVTDALAALADQDLGQARAILEQAQRETETIYIDTAP